jgi:hypothetical protein
LQVVAEQPVRSTRRSKRKVNPQTGALPKRRHDLYYLFAGMGGASARKRMVRNYIWALLIGIAVAAALVGIMYLAYKP